MSVGRLRLSLFAVLAATLAGSGACGTRVSWRLHGVEPDAGDDALEVRLDPTLRVREQREALDRGLAAAGDTVLRGFGWLVPREGAAPQPQATPLAACAATPLALEPVEIYAPDNPAVRIEAVDVGAPFWFHVPLRALARADTIQLEWFVDPPTAGAPCVAAAARPGPRRVATFRIERIERDRTSGVGLAVLALGSVMALLTAITAF